MNLDADGSRCADAQELADSRRILAQRSALVKSHPVFRRIRSIDDLRVFMSWHVFAVWDFMSLTKRLQHEFTSLSLPWTPPTNPSAARLINDIVLGEESDVLPDGGYASHYDLYLSAMREIGADTRAIERLVELVRSHIDPDTALRMVDAPAPVATFVRATIECAVQGSPCEVLGNFLFGREDAIPQMFTAMLSEWSIPEERTPAFLVYLHRHIDLDSNSHGPAARRLVDQLVGGSDRRRAQICRAGIDALDQRIALWDALVAELDP